MSSPLATLCCAQASQQRTWPEAGPIVPLRPLQMAPGILWCPEQRGRLGLWRAEACPPMALRARPTHHHPKTAEVSALQEQHPATHLTHPPAVLARGPSASAARGAGPRAAISVSNLSACVSVGSPGLAEPIGSATLLQSLARTALTHLGGCVGAAGANPRGGGGVRRLQRVPAGIPAPGRAHCAYRVRGPAVRRCAGRWSELSCTAAPERARRARRQ